MLLLGNAEASGQMLQLQLWLSLRHDTNMFLQVSPNSEIHTLAKRYSTQTIANAIRALLGIAEASRQMLQLQLWFSLRHDINKMLQISPDSEIHTLAKRYSTQTITNAIRALLGNAEASGQMLQLQLWLSLRHDINMFLQISPNSEIHTLA